MGKVPNFKGVHTPSGWSKRVKDGSAAMPEQWLQIPQTLIRWTLREPEIWIPKIQYFTLSHFSEPFLPPPTKPMARPALSGSTLIGGPGFGDPVVVEWGEASELGHCIRFAVCGLDGSQLLPGKVTSRHLH
ncbi:hypothetical protein FKM82_019120 [Ascaphus truei]